MTGTDPERLPRRWRWAAEQLGLSPDVSPEEARAAWLRQLPENDFVPLAAEQWALASLLRREPEGGREARADEAAALAEEERLREEVETFAGQFWDAPPDNRRRRWRELADRCSLTPALKARLCLLEPGLDCAPVLNETAKDARVVELAGHIRELFVLRPGPRARARQTLLHRMKENIEEWQVAVRRLCQICPALASLGNDLLNKILIGTPKPERLPARPPAQPATADSGGNTNRWPIWIIVMIVMAGGRVFLNKGCQSNSTTSPSRYFKEKNFRPNEGNEGRNAVPPFLQDFNKKHKLRVVEDKDGKKRLIGMKIPPDQKSDRERGNPGARQEKKDGRGP